jgi:hypothetical protein
MLSAAVAIMQQSGQNNIIYAHITQPTAPNSSNNNKNFTHSIDIPTKVITAVPLNTFNINVVAARADQIERIKINRVSESAAEQLVGQAVNSVTLSRITNVPYSHSKRESNHAQFQNNIPR